MLLDFLSSLAGGGEGRGWWWWWFSYGFGFLEAAVPSSTSFLFALFTLPPRHSGRAVYIPYSSRGPPSPADPILPYLTLLPPYSLGSFLRRRAREPANPRVLLSSHLRLAYSALPVSTVPVYPLPGLSLATYKPPPSPSLPLAILSASPPPPALPPDHHWAVCLPRAPPCSPPRPLPPYSRLLSSCFSFASFSLSLNQ